MNYIKKNNNISWYNLATIKLAFSWLWNDISEDNGMPDFSNCIWSNLEQKNKLTYFDICDKTYHDIFVAI